MTESQSTTPASFLTNAAARAYGFTDEFWLEVYTRYEEALFSDPDNYLNAIERSRTIRMPFREGSVDVLVRCQPKPYEELIMRFTAFPVADGDEFKEISRSYWYDGPREVLGEAALLDASNRW